MPRSSAAAICSAEWVETPMIASGPSSSRAAATEASSCADVDPVGVAGARQVGVVVDDEEGAVGVGDAAVGVGGAFDLRPPELLLAQLDDVDAAAERRPQQRFQVAAAGARVADEVEAGGAQPLAPQRSVALWGEKLIPRLWPPGCQRRRRTGASERNGSPAG